ncbi:MAG: aldo/keto reductase [Draconibacterium sp.]|nr:aldo/keto reductase [Draconibacterium sp.]
MKRIDRRKFIQNGAKGVAGTIVLGSGLANLSFVDKSETIDVVKFGETGLEVPRVALGTGSYGYRHTSQQHKLGEKTFVKLAKYAYEKGLRFYETADMYGTHEFVGAAMKQVPREDITLLSKVMVYQHGNWYTPEPFQKSIDRFRKELQTDYVDVLLLHCMVNTEWPDEYKRYMDNFSEAKEKGIIKKVGLSCHDFGALQIAAESDWADILLARINYDGAKMDASPQKVMPVLQKAKESGKGVIGMKVFGCGDLTTDEQREKSLNYVIKSKNVHAMTIGFKNNDEIDDAVSRINRIAKSL